MLQFCDELGEEDGINPTELAKQTQQNQRRNSSSSARSRHRLTQLCRQVMRGIDDALWCDCCDPLLSDLRTIDVRPQGGSSALIATLITTENDPEMIQEIHDRLRQASGMIRASIAGVIHRKRVPSIQFRVIPERRG